MNKKIFTLIRAELTIQTRLNNLIKYLLFFFAFCIFSINFVHDYSSVNQSGIIFSIIAIPLALIGLSHTIFKQDMNDGTLENYKSIFSSGEIVLAKFIALLLCTLGSFILCLPIITIIYNIESNYILPILLGGTILSISTSALLCLIASVQCYFRSNTNFLSILIMPIIIPNIILVGLMIQNTPLVLNYFGILCGINIILVPISILFTTYLIENIYNI